MQVGAPVFLKPVRVQEEVRARIGMNAETVALFPDEFERWMRMFQKRWEIKYDEIADFLNGIATQKFLSEDNIYFRYTVDDWDILK
jgi:hypothetical protein